MPRLGLVYEMLAVYLHLLIDVAQSYLRLLSVSTSAATTASCQLPHLAAGRFKIDIPLTFGDLLRPAPSTSSSYLCARLQLCCCSFCRCSCCCCKSQQATLIEINFRIVLFWGLMSLPYLWLTLTYQLFISLLPLSHPVSLCLFQSFPHAASSEAPTF